MPAAIRNAITSSILVLVGSVLGCREKPTETAVQPPASEALTRSAGSGKRRTELRQQPAFRRLDVKGSLNVRVNIGEAQKIEVTADENLIELVITVVEGETLVIDTKGSFKSESPIEVAISIPDLERLEMRGSGNAVVQNVTHPSFRVDIYGSGSADLSGKTENASLEISGSGNIEATKLIATSADVEISGSGSASVYASGALRVEISGSGTVRYTGSPKNVEKKISGSGAVTGD